VNFTTTVQEQYEMPQCCYCCTDCSVMKQKMWTTQPLKMKPLCSFEILGNNDTGYTSGDQKPQQNRCANLKSCTMYTTSQIWRHISLILHFKEIFCTTENPKFVSALISENCGVHWNNIYTVIPRLTKIIRSGITFVSRNFSLSRT